ncbi:MAG: Lipoprotein-releasing system ATP-binding protein LolD [Alphaproteobacteria bacterium]|nr:MAG: Lipoprotein-releasing system ATP-binding protein LolD [Alphaproteobacteria bacterium]
MSEHVAIEKIERRFVQGTRDLHVLRGASLSLAAGEVVALVGPSGSGKSSLLHIVGLLEKPDAGSIYLRGKPVDTDNDGSRTEERLQHIGFVYQFHNLLPEFTAQENIALAARLAGQGRIEAMQHALAAMERLGLADRATHLPSQLSGGEQQRVAIARALANQPSLVLADEPTGSLDGAAGEKVADLLLDEAKTQNAAVLLATHDMELAARADRIVRLRDGIIHSD